MSPEQAKAAIAVLDDQSIPLNDRYPGFKSIDEDVIAKTMAESPEAAQMYMGLKMIGRKVMPLASADQAQHWIGSIIAALSDLSPVVSIPAIKATIHKPISAHWDIETKIRESVGEFESRHWLARHRLELFLRQIKTASEPKLPPPPPLTLEDWEQFNLQMRSSGLDSRYFADEDEVRPLEPDEPDPADDIEPGKYAQPPPKPMVMKAKPERGLSPAETQRRAKKLIDEFEKDEKS